MKSEKCKENKITITESSANLSGRYRLIETSEELNYKYPSEAQYGNKMLHVFEKVNNGELIEREMKDVEKID
ncbi:MAG TPA: hypothetical protein VHD83_08470 [Puia sp.]|nr:hypothetical protein [Puia sp.]